MRMILVDWMVEVAEEYKLASETLYLAVNYLDRYLSKRLIQRGNLQLVGMVCMLIAGEFEYLLE
jgi:cyclin A